MELNRPILTKRVTSLCYSASRSGPEREAFLARCAQEPDLQEHLERSIRLHLADYPAYNLKDPEATMLCNLPDARGHTVSPFPGAVAMLQLSASVLCSAPAHQSVWRHVRHTGMPLPAVMQDASEVACKDNAAGCMPQCKTSGSHISVMPGRLIACCMMPTLLHAIHLVMVSQGAHELQDAYDDMFVPFR